MTTLFDNRRRAARVRLVIWGVLLASLATAWWGWDISQSYGLAPGDGGALRPARERYGLGGLVAGLGLLAGLGTMFWATHYAVRVRRGGDRLIVETLAPLGLGTWSRDYAVSQVETYSYNEGQMRGGGRKVDAPWMALRINGRRWPFILDWQAETMLGGGLSGLTKRKPRKLRKSVARL